VSTRHVKRSNAAVVDAKWVVLSHSDAAKSSRAIRRPCLQFRVEPLADVAMVQLQMPGIGEHVQREREIKLNNSVVPPRRDPSDTAHGRFGSTDGEIRLTRR
jgi:hypothetical protein